ncbi:MAG TPA: Wzz/FepE/Etk N-terminal domain-containing protein [Baekduia sp.]|nr:Wzz/FepE/Etk N-terminal domain-containing protein [Baekduia sp.]
MNVEPTQMTSGIERLTDALRRYRRLLVLCVLAGVAVALVISAVSEPEYRATAQVLLDEEGTGAILPGADANATDAQRSASTAVTLAGSGAFYDRVSLRFHGLASRVDPPALPGDFSVDEQPGTSLLSITATASGAATAQKLANAVAAEFPRFRADTLQRPLRQTERSLQSQLDDNPDDQQIQDSLSRVRVLERLAQRSAAVVDSAQSADKIRPIPARDAVIGLVSGLVIGLLLMALREGLSSRVREDEMIERALGARVVASLPRRDRGGERTAAAIERLVVLLGGHRNPSRDTVVCVLGGAGVKRTGEIAEAVRAELSRRGEAVTQIVADTALDNGMAGVLALPEGTGAGAEPVAGAVAVTTGAVGGGWVVVDGPQDVASALVLELVRVADVVVLAVADDLARRELVALSRELDMWPRRPYVAVLTLG